MELTVIKSVGIVRIFCMIMRQENVWMDAMLAGKESVVKGVSTGMKKC